VLGNSKVVWKEGMFLQPQHFQQSERHILDIVNSRLASYVPHCYGFAAYAVNADAVLNGTLSITGCSGVMPDGTPFEIPAASPPPPVRPFGDHFAHDQQTLNVYLGLPLPIEGKANVGAAGQSGPAGSRYRSQTVSVADEVRGTQRKEVEVGALNFSLLYEGESRDNHTTLQIARLVRGSTGQVELDETFVPPLIHVGASPHLMQELRSLLEVLLAKNASLSQGRRQRASGLAEFKGSEETAFRLLQTINTYAPLLNYYHVAPSVHPYELFLLLTQLAGALTTFSAEVSIRQLPRYEHASLKDVFGVFSQIIRTVLGADLSSASVTLPIEQTGPATYVCRVADERLLSAAKFYFGVSASVGEKELVVGALQRIKMCSRDRLELLIPSAMPGLPLIHTARPPEALSTKPGFVYFSLDQKSDFWEGIKTSGSIAFYFPNNYPDLKMELLALRE
jgi:type VI secretion system protein ImpJ